MKVKMIVTIEADNFEFIPQLVAEMNEALRSETDNGCLVKRDNDSIKWNTTVE